MGYLGKGNKKLDKGVLRWSLPPIKSCLNCEMCKSSYYAMKAYRLYPTTIKAWDHNLMLAKTGYFRNLLIKELLVTRNVKFVRIHVSGDFISQRYINDWSVIISLFPEITFYAYTKVYHLFDFTELDSLKNCNIINSIVSETGGVNFGDLEYIRYLESIGYKTCPAGYYKNVKCGKDCTLCHTHKKICFIKH